MHLMRIGLFATALALVPPAFAQDAKDAGKPDVAKEFQALVEKFKAEEAEFMKPVEDAKTDEAKNKAFEALDQTKNPTKAYLDKMNDLAERADGTETGARALLFVVTDLGPSPDVARRNLNILLDDYMQSPVMSEVAQAIGFGFVPPVQAAAMYQRLLDDCPIKDVKATALMAIARSKLESGAADDAKVMFKRLKEEFGDTDAAKRGAAAMFEIERLQVGMTVPDIEATDQDGRTFKLSDYKGKVVVIDFWGFW